MGILEAIAGVLVLFWILGLAFHIAGGLIHLLLIAAIVILAIKFLGRAFA